MKPRLSRLVPILGLFVLLQAGPGTAHGVVPDIAQKGGYYVMYSFSGRSDGGVPIAALLRDAQGNLYGTTTHQTGRDKQLTLGNIFKLDPSATLTALHTFSAADGGTPEGALIADSAGNLYGTTNAFGPAGVGSAYRLDPSLNLKVLLDFHNSNVGANPVAGLTLYNGHLYGTAYDGGNDGLGTVYELGANGGVKVLHTFAGKPDGAYPQGGLFYFGNGAFVGTTSAGGSYGRGTLYVSAHYSPDKAGLLYTFGPAPDGRAPALGNVVRNASSAILGTTYYGGKFDKGTIFKLDAYGKESIVYSFAGKPDGAYPVGGLVLDKAGNIYGTTLRGGSGCGNLGCGTVFKIDTFGNVTILHTFTGGADGAFPASGLIGDGGGHYFGTTEFGGGATVKCGSAASGCGTIYEVTP